MQPLFIVAMYTDSRGATRLVDLETEDNTIESIQKAVDDWKSTESGTPLRIRSIIPKVV